MLENRKKHLFIPLIIFTLLMTLSVVILLVRVIREFSSEQMRGMSENIIELLQEGLERAIREESLLEISDFNDDVLLGRLNEAHSAYVTEGRFTYENLFDQSPYISRIGRMRELFGIDADFHISLLSKEGLVIASSMESSVGSHLLSGNEVNKSKLDSYLSTSPDRQNLLLFDHHDRDMELVLVFPLSRFFPGRESRDIIVSAVFSHLNIYRTLLQERFRIPRGNLFLIDQRGDIIENPRPGYEIRSREEKEIIDRLYKTMRESPDSPVVMNQPYRSYDREKMIATGVWVGSLDLGIVIELQASEILAPWIYLSSLIISIVIASFLLFLIILISIDRHRLRAYDSNPITHLPGNQIIQKEIGAALKKKEMMVIYCDLDNFKAFNDTYGFSAGDEIIAFSAALLLKIFVPRRKIFVGHIGGDDFVLLGKRGDLESLCDTFGKEFDEQIKSHYNDEDRKNGFIVSKDRKGEIHQFPLIAMSMGAVMLDHHRDAHPLKIAEICSEVKKEAKKMTGSRLFIDQRSDRRQS